MAINNVIEYALRVDTEQGILSLKKTGQFFDQIGDKGESSSRRAAGGLESLFTKTVALNQALEIAQKAFHLLSTPIEKIISIGANFETLRMQLDTVMQSASKGKEYFEWIQEFAARTPFQMEGLTKTVIMLENFGINAKTSLETIGNTAAALNTDMTDLSRVLGQIYNKPKASMEEMLQLVERGVPVFDILKKQLGLTADQMANLGNQGIEGKKVFDALMQGMNERYGGAMERMSKSWAGLWSTFQDNINIALGKVAAPLIENFKVKLNAILEQLDKWTKDGTLDRWAKQAVDFITGVVDAISSIAKTLWALKDVIIAVGEAWAVSFALYKFQPVIAGLGSISTYFRVLRAEGGTVFKSFSGSANEAFSSLKGQIKSLPTNIKIGLTIAAAGIALQFIDKGVKYLEEQYGVKYKSPGEFLGVFKYVLDVGTGAGGMFNNMLQGTLENNLKKVFDSIKSNYKLTLEQIKVISENYNIKIDPFNLPQMQRDFASAIKQIESYKKASIDLYNASIDKISQQSGLIGLLGRQIASLLPPTEEARKAAEKARIEDEKLKTAKLAAAAAAKVYTEEVQKTAEKLGFFTGSTADLEKQTRLLQAALKLSGDQFGSNKEAANKVIKEVDDLKAAYLGMGKAVPPVLDEILLKAQQTKIRLSEIEIPELTDEEIEKGMTDILKEGEKAWESYSEKVDAAAFALLSLEEKQKLFLAVAGLVTGQLGLLAMALNSNIGYAKSFADILNEVADFLAPVGSLLSQAADQLGGLGIISENVAKTMTGVGRGIDTIVSGIDSVNKIGGSIFDKISGGLSIVTGAISIVSNLLSSLFERDWEGEAALMLSRFGGATDEMKEKLAELAEQMGSTQDAMNALMGEFISEANIQTKEQFLTWLRGVYGLLNEAKNNNSAEAIENLNNAFEALVSKGESLGLLGTEFQTLVDRIRASGIELESLTTFINNQLDKATAGLNTYIAAGINSQGQFQTAVNLTLSLYNTLIENGVSRLDAFTRMKDIFQSLFDSALKSGYQMSSAFRELYDFQNKVAKNQSLVDSITGLNDLLTGLANSGIKLSQKAWNDFAFSANDTYNQLLKAGFSGSEALSMIAPVLQNLQVMAGRYNLTIDETTQSLIDQATEQGLLSEQTKSDSQVIIGLLGAIADALGAQIPESLQTLVNAASGSMDAATVVTKKYQNSVTTLGEEISEIPEIIGNVGEKNEEVTNEVIEQNQNLINNLQKIGDAYYMNSTALEVFGVQYQGLISVIAGTEEIVDKLAGGYEAALLNMGGNTDTLAGLIDDLADALGVTIPDTLDSLEDKYKYVMAAMAKQTEKYFLGPDGVLRDLLDTLAYIGQQTQNQGGENYGVYTDTQKQEMTVEFFQKTHLWQNNRDTILASKDNMERFVSDLEKLVVVDSAKAQYDKFMASMRQWYAHLEKGDVWDAANQKWISAPGGGGGGGENFGIYTDAQKQAMTTRLNQMATLWQNNKDEILTKEANLRSFYNELDGLVVIASAQSKYDNLMNAVKAAKTHLDKGDTWDPVNDKWVTAAKAAIGASFIVPNGFEDDSFPLRVKTGELVNVYTVEETRKIMNILNNIHDYQAYLPDYQAQGRQGNEQDDEEEETRLPFNPFQVSRRTTLFEDFQPEPARRPQSNASQEPQKIQLQQTGPTYINNYYFPRGTSQNDKEIIVQCVREAVRDNKDGFTAFIKENIEEYDA